MITTIILLAIAGSLIAAITLYDERQGPEARPTKIIPVRPFFKPSEPMPRPYDWRHRVPARDFTTPETYLQKLTKERHEAA